MHLGPWGAWPAATQATHYHYHYHYHYHHHANPHSGPWSVLDVHVRLLLLKVFHALRQGSLTRRKQSLGSYWCCGEEINGIQLNNYYFKYLFMPINKLFHYHHLFHFILVRQTQSFCNIIPELLEPLEVHHDVNSLVVMRICWWSQIQLQGHCWLNQSVWKCGYFFDESSPASHWHSSHCPAQHPPGNSSQRATITYIHYLSN